jgi:hypothetical protein
MAAMFEDVHQQFTVVAERDGQFVAAVGEPAARLLGVPVLIADPAGAFRGEF